MKEILEILILLLVANGAPVFVSYLFSHKRSLAVDFGFKLKDQRYLFGETKTWRGVFSSIIFTVLVSELIGLGFKIGLTVAVLAMTGDLFSSFVKRRLNKKSSSKALLLDQVPESLFPTMIIMLMLSLSLIQVMVIVTVFIIMELTLSYLLFKMGIRKRPY